LARILIIGADGFIGHTLAEAFASQGHAVCGTTRRERSDGAGERIRLDLATVDANEVSLPAADAAIFCAAMARFADCREQPELTRRVNVTGPSALARRLTAAGTHVVMLSTSAVFDGSTRCVAAEQKTAAVSAYGAQKAEIEAEILALGKKASVLRLTKVISPDMPLFNGWIGSLARGEKIRAFDDLTFSPIRAADVVAAAGAIVEERAGGIYQVSGADDISYATAAEHFAAKLGASRSLIERARAVEHSIPASEVPRFTTLDTSRLQKLTGWVPPRAFEVLDSVFAHLLPARELRPV